MTTTPTLNKLGTLKEIGAMEYRLADEKLDPNIRLHVLRRSLDNLIDTTPRKFHGIIAAARRALNDGDTLELTAALALLRSMVRMTYGCVLQGQVFEAVGRGIHIKSKGGRIDMLTGNLLPHFPGDTPVNLMG